MSKTNGNEPIQSGFEHDTTENGIEFHIPKAGLTKREYFAALAMQGILAGAAYNEEQRPFICRDAIATADALIESLNQEKL